MTEEQAVNAQLALARREGIPAGMSSGAALAAAFAIAARPTSAGKKSWSSCRTAASATPATPSSKSSPPASASRRSPFGG